MGLHETRCKQCDTLLCKENIEIGDIEIKCYRCNKLNYLEYSSKVIENLFTAAMA